MVYLFLRVVKSELLPAQSLLLDLLEFNDLLFLPDDRRDDLEDLGHFFEGLLLLILGNDLRRGILDLQQIGDHLAIGEVLLLHHAPNDKAFAEGVLRDEIAEVLTSTGILNQDSVLLDNKSFHCGANHVLVVVLIEFHQWQQTT